MKYVLDASVALSWVLALAEQEHCEVVTVDDRFINSVQKRFPFVVHLSTLP